MSAEPETLFMYAERKPSGRQNGAVYEVMKAGAWWTLPHLQAYLMRQYVIISEAGLSARIRDMRKPPVNGTVERRKDGSLWEYRLTL